MRILLITPQFPYPPHQGTTLRNFHLLRGLAAHHTIDLFSLLAPGDDPNAGPVSQLVDHLVIAPQPARSSRQRLTDLVRSRQPDMALRLWSDDAFARLRTHLLTHSPDLIQIEGIEMAPYFFALRGSGIELPPVIYDAHNAETLLQRRAFQADVRRPARWPAALYSVIQVQKLQRYERKLLLAVAGVAAVSEPDAGELAALAPGIWVEVVSNGVDLDAYDPDGEFANPYLHPGPNLVFTGKMDFRPNIDAVLWFAERVLPQLHATNLDLHFWVVGKNPHARLDSLRSRPDITITGSVPDIHPYIAHADLYVVPLLAGGGTRLKLLEAMAMARPIVSTRLGADGFPVTDAEQLALADTPAEFRARCEQLLRQPGEAAALGRRGRAFVEANYGWDAIVPRLEHLYRRIS
ncbi:MAG: glycosyltransferase [Caldilineales bacterium]|nr:glycosyltransferase [Caldilineales bacterium]